MIKGMTGFGSSQLSTGNIKAVVEIKSVNHRYLDISFYLPTGFGAIEDRIRQAVQKHLERGRVTIAIKIIQKPVQTVLLNKGVVKQHLRYAHQLKREFRLDNDLSLTDIIGLPGVLEVKEKQVDAQRSWPSIERGLKSALSSLVTMRRREGRSLAADVGKQLKRMSIQINKIKARSKTILAEKKKKLTTEEFKSFQKGCDINEEVSRLAHYIDELRKLLKSNAAVGKKIDFIAQEMQRETNTVGSKLQDKVVSNSVIALKSKVEKIREQAQNVE